MKWQKGYTLIEILVALAVIGLLFAIGYINFRDFARRQALSGAAKQVQADLRLDQQMAFSGEKPDDPLCNAPNTLSGYRFGVISTTQYRFQADCSGGPSNVIDHLVTMPSDITISITSPNPIIFKILGQGTNIPSGQNTVITLTQVSTGSTATITVTASGEIQ